MNLPPGPIRIKVCGITRKSDAEALDALGVDYLGFNFFAGSKRHVEPEAAAAMIAKLKRAQPVGVFVDEAPDRIAAVAAMTGICLVQLHGGEGWEILSALALPVIKALPHTRLRDFGGLKAGWDEAAAPEFFLVDTGAVSGFGGSGKSFDWSLLKTHPLPRPFFLAGGLGPENLAPAIRRTRPYAVDLNSGLESAPGIKDIALAEKCLALVKR